MLSLRVQWEWILLGALCVLSACTPAALKETVVPTIPISNASGEVTASQPGPLWVLLSGVDEHGILIEPDVQLLAAPGLQVESLASITSGAPAIVREIRHLGPQNLQRYYFVELLNGEQGWLSDFYVRRLAYLFNIEGSSVPVHQDPGGTILAELPNVSPAVILDPHDPAWWQVRTADGAQAGWVLAQFVKESSEEEFLLQYNHAHTP